MAAMEQQINSVKDSMYASISKQVSLNTHVQLLHVVSLHQSFRSCLCFLSVCLFLCVILGLLQHRQAGVSMTGWRSCHVCIQ